MTEKELHLLGLCILFNKSPGLNNTPGEPYMVCGKYKIKKLK